MAVSLKKPEKVSLEKTELPPKVRECTPVHLIDEEETIQRPRQPPNQPQHLTKNENEVKLDDKELEAKIKQHRRLKDVHPLMMLATVIAILTCIFVVVFLLTDRFSDVDNLPVESTPTESVSNMEISSVTAAESVPIGDTSSLTGYFSEFFRFAFRFIRENPLALGMIGISLLFLLVSMVRKIVGLGRYDK